MAAQEPDGETSREARLIATRLGELSTALTERGLTVRVGAAAVMAWNPAASRLSQYVALCGHADRSLHWYWCWTGPSRKAPLETEYMCAAEEITHAADLIAKVLRVGDSEDG
ncbi:hypothetical protein NE235_30865 [Actinoallomurus spadix]|uniref:Uncharacterized protein n=1 Tax=Actinoallomurus spadix TaxID=79912 RepID=A0ABN0XTR9_9ACTN|nr:hypothetical protein [Actinoallomurus spadix]MCO5990519.1 hypothetical protein [Actinoallomurus spadix]